MRLLLDTHSLLWWAANHPSLPDSARKLIQPEKNTILVSAATAWEIAIKFRLGKFPAAANLVSDLAGLLQRYGLYYCFGDYLNSKGRPASSSPTVPGQATLMPIEAVALLFFSQPPHPELQRSISYILKLAMQIAATNGLLSLPNNAQGYKLQLQQASLSALSELVPHRKQDAELMTTNNPLADPIIADRLTRDLYRYIDGRKNVQELCAVTHLGLKEVAVALRTLLAERRIELFDSSGQLKNGLSLLNNL